MELFGTIGAAIYACKKLGQVSMKLHDAEFKNLLADLTLKLVDIKMKCAEVQEENLALKKSISQKQSAELQRPDVLRDGAYFFSNPPEGRPAGPYCTNFFDISGRLVLVTELSASFRRIAKYRCNNCKGHFGSNN